MSVREAHRRALQEGASFYVDPDTGLHVFTEIGLRARGRCCGSGCRHCPFQHESMSLPDRAARGQRSSWLTAASEYESAVDLLFWSGGKDSFLALRALRREAMRPVVLLTTFDVGSRVVAHQEIAIDEVVRQAEHLGIALIGAPLHAGGDYMETIGEACDLVPRIARFVFGDLHLAHIRDWRSAAFAELAAARGAELHFPLWGVSYDVLIDDLEASGVTCEVSAVTGPARQAVAAGQRFDRAMMRRLPQEIDEFGENGEFHTLAKVWERNGRQERSTT